MTLIKLKDILLENVTKEERKERLPGYIEDGAAGGSGSGKSADEAPPSGADIKKYLTTKAKDLAKQFKGNKLFKEYRISSAILASAGDNHEIIIGIKPKQGGEGLIPIKMHVYGKKFVNTLAQFEFVESAWKVGQFLEPAGSGTVRIFIDILKFVYGEREQWEKKDIQFITPAGEKTLDDFTGEGQEDSDEDEEIASRGGVATKDFERLSTDDIISQIDNWSKIQGTGAFRDLQKKIASKRI
jgi:hypothetical protein